MGEVINLPIAHGEGCYYADEKTLEELEANHQVLFRYGTDKTPKIEENPNGSLNNIAGICNVNRNVFGLMPHPDRSGEDILGSHDGNYIWQSILSAKVGAS